VDKQQLVVCAVFENAAARLSEWLAYHTVVGAGHFVLYDNGSTDDPARVIRNSPLAEHVTLIRWPQRPGRLTAYRHFIDIFAPGFAWAAFLGVDEFLLPLAGNTVMQTLDLLGLAAAVLVHRRAFAPGPWQGLAIESFDRRAGDDFPANRQVRVIARCSDLLDVGQDPDTFRVNGQVVNTAGHLAPNAAIQALPCYHNLVVNQYCTGPREAWLAALHQDHAAAGGEAMTAEELVPLLSRQADTALQSFAPAVRALLGLPTRSPAPIEPPPPPQADPAQPAPADAAPPSGPAPRTAGAPAAAFPTAPDDAPTARGDEQDRGDEQNRAAPEDLRAGPVWVSRGEDAQERLGGVALVFRDRSHAGEHWLAALRGAAAAGIDPAFLMDEFDRIRDFASADAARAACDAALAPP